MELTGFESTGQGVVFLQLSNNYCFQGTEMADKGLLEEALEIFDKAIEINPNNHVAYFNRATIKIDLGDLEGAKKDFEQFDIITSI